MNAIVNLELAGIGIIIYSPWAVAHIVSGDDYLSTHFSDPDAVGDHVRACSLTAFCTGSSGQFSLKVSTEPVDLGALQTAQFKIALGIEVRDQIACIRDLYDLLDWEPECPRNQQLSLDDGFYHITAFTSLPPEGPGNGQVIHLCFQRTSTKPQLTWPGVPQLC